MRPMLAKVMVPVMTHVLPPAYHRWIDVATNYTCKIIGMSLAW